MRWHQGILCVAIASIISLPAEAAVPPPPTRITTRAGQPFRLYDSVVVHQPAQGGLRDRGFLPAVVWDRPVHAGHFDVGIPPAYLLQDGSADEADLRRQVAQICTQDLNPDETTLVILDAEWEIISSLPATSRVPYPHYAIHARNLANMTTILKWVHSEFANSGCRARVRTGWYNSVPTLWNSFYIKPWDTRTTASWRKAVSAQVDAFAPYIAVLSPSLYAAWAPDATPNLGMSYITAWKIAAVDTLLVAKKSGAQYGLAVVPFIGLRYYHGRPPYLNKYVDRNFFNTMIATISDPKYGCEGAVYWDWSGYGGAKFANDGTDAWDTAAPWYVATFDFFSSPSGSPTPSRP